MTKCLEKIKAGKGNDLAPKSWLGFYSYQSVYDTVNPNGDYNTFPYYEVLNHLHISTKKLFREVNSIKKPILVLYGQNDEFCYGKVPEIINLLKDKTKNLANFTYKILPDCDHGFVGKEDVLAKTISEWLTQ